MKLDPKVLNDGLRLAMEFGEHGLGPIQARLAELHPALSETERDAYGVACRKAMNAGHALVVECLRDAGGDQIVATRAFRKALAQRFSWINDENLTHLFSQGSYYAWKNGELPT